MRHFNISLWLAVVAVIVSLTSCDPLSSAEFNIYNVTSDTVTVTFHKEIMTSAYKGYDIEENDSVTTHCDSDSCVVAILAPTRKLTIHREWNGLYREEQIVPAWKYIASISIGDTELNPEKWNNESAWNMKKKGGGFAEGESRYYSLLLR